MGKEAAGKNPHAVALGRLGGKKGGPVKMRLLTEEERSAFASKGGLASVKTRATWSPEKRSAIARHAAEARWKKVRDTTGK